MLKKELLNAHNSFVNSVIKIDDLSIVTASDDKSIKIWQLADYAVLKELNFDVGQWCLLKINDDYAAAGDYTGKIRIFRLRDWFCEIILEGHG